MKQVAKRESDLNVLDYFKIDEFNLIPRDWRVVKLGDVFEFSKKPKQIVIEKKEVVPFISMELISETSNKVKGWKLKKISQISSGTFVFKNDLIIAKITPCFENGKQAILDNLPKNYGFATTEIWALHPKNEEVLIENLYNFLKLPVVRSALASKMEGATGRQRLPRHVLKNLFIPIPPLPEQKKIAVVLRAVQEAKEKTEEVIKAAKELKKSLMKHLFTYGPVSIKEAEKVKLKETEIGTVPAVWNVRALGKIADFRNGINFSREQKGERGILTIDVLNMYGEDIYIKLNNLYRVNKKINEEYLLKNGDMLFVRSSLKQEGVGWTSLFQEINEPVTYCGFIIRARLKIFDNLSPKFITHYLRTDIARQNLIASSGKVAITNINQGMLSKIKVPLPSTGIQKKVIEVLSSVDKKIETEENKKNALEVLFKALLNNLMTGKIRVNNLDIEV